MAHPPASGSTPGARPAGVRLLTQPALWSALAALALYLPTLRFDFAWDDFELVVRNPLLTKAAEFARAVELEPAFGDGWLHLARACADLGDGAGRDTALARASGLPGADLELIASLRSARRPRPAVPGTP